MLFPLSVPTVPRPTALAAGGRYVFVLSATAGELGFVDTAVSAEDAGPIGLAGADGFPISQPLPFLPTALAAIEAGHELAPGQRDLGIAVGITSAGDGELVLVSPPVPGADGLLAPAIVASVALPRMVPSSIALDPPGRPAALLLGPDGAPVDDCRTVAVADRGFQPDGSVEPAIALLSLRITAAGAVSIAEVGPRLQVRIPALLPNGVPGERAVPVRHLAFAPSPAGASVDAALAADPCAIRSGRLFAVLDSQWCVGSEECADLAVLDLPAGTLAHDPSFQGPAVYDLPGAALQAVALSGPLTPPGAFDSLTGRSLTRLPDVVLVASSDGGLYYVDGGLGTPLSGPGPDDRAAADPVRLVDAEASGPAASAVSRTDTVREGTESSLPAVAVPAGAAPTDESWFTGFETALPGLGSVGTLAGLSIEGDSASFTLAAGDPRNFLFPFEVVAGAGPGLVDRLVPADPAGVCPGFPITEVSGDGRTLRVAYAEPPGACQLGELPLSVLPPEELPWVLAGSLTGFVGRLPPSTPQGPAVSDIHSGDRLLFRFTPRAQSPGILERGASFTWITTDGFINYGAYPGSVALLPTDMVARLLAPPAALAPPEWQLFVTFSGADAMIELDPELPSAEDQLLYQ